MDVNLINFLISRVNQDLKSSMLQNTKLLSKLNYGNSLCRIDSLL